MAIFSCLYKAAVEPYTRSEMSPEAREANRAMIDELWQDYIARLEAAGATRDTPMPQAGGSSCGHHH